MVGAYKRSEHAEVIQPLVYEEDALQFLKQNSLFISAYNPAGEDNKS